MDRRIVRAAMKAATTLEAFNCVKNEEYGDYVCLFSPDDDEHGFIASIGEDVNGAEIETFTSITQAIDLLRERQKIYQDIDQEWLSKNPSEEFVEHPAILEIETIIEKLQKMASYE